MEKHAVIQAIVDALVDDFHAFKRASAETRGGGSDHEARSEGKYDTRSTEANYLADGQARQAEAAALAAAAYRDLLGVPPSSAAGVGALVEIDFGDECEWFFIGPAAGGVEVTVSGKTVTVLSSESPLSQKLAGLAAGDAIPGMNARLVTLL